ncbi:hypothetical protein [Algibacter sp. Ld11]|uniref:hypothetical protein n=1 Tax=Algibacter sp. Ld11 TaxID=649150 RepID=UPI00386E9477
MNTLNQLSRFKENIVFKIIKFDNANTQANWLLKRIALHIVWGTLNVVGVIYLFKIITNTILEYFFLIIGVAYCLMYWIIASKIFDRLIGDEIDHLSRWKH